MKKILATILSVILIISICPMGLFSITASAATSGTTGECTWSLDGTVLTISGNGAMGDYDVYKSNPAPWGDKITKAIIKEGVTAIGADAFFNSTKLTDVEIPTSVTRIEPQAFTACYKLEKVNIESLESWCNIDFWGLQANPVWFAKSLYLNNSLITELVIPNSVTNIKQVTFANCDSIKSVIIPNSVKSIGQDSFANIDGLKTINIPNSVTSIGDEAFYGCTSLTSITIPNSVTSIGWNAFTGCKSLQKITLPFVGNKYNGTSNTHFGYIFGASTYSQNEVYVPTSLKTVVITGGNLINDRAFSKCSNIEEVIITDNVREIGYRAFEYCTNLKGVYIPNSVQKFGIFVFDKCNLLTIYSPKGSVAETEAKDSTIKFVASNIYKDNLGEVYGDGCGANSHTYGGWEQTKAPTCTQNGVESRICSSCRIKENHYIEATGHSLGSWETTKASTCETKGEQTRSCSKCSYKETKPIDALGHEFSSPTITKQPTCTETGIESGKCSRCNKETSNIIPPVAHKVENFVVTVEPTCIADGKKEGVCTVCGAPNAEEIIKAKGHTFGESVVIKEATTTETGIKTKTCTICGEKEYENIPVISKDSDGFSKRELIIFGIVGVVLIAAAVVAIILMKKFSDLKKQLSK